MMGQDLADTFKNGRSPSDHYVDANPLTDIPSRFLSNPTDLNGLSVRLIGNHNTSNKEYNPHDVIIHADDVDTAQELYVVVFVELSPFRGRCLVCDLFVRPTAPPIVIHSLTEQRWSLTKQVKLSLHRWSHHTLYYAPCQPFHRALYRH